MSTSSAAEVVIGIQFGINHTSNACRFKYDQPKGCEEFNVPYDTQSNTCLSITTPTVALFDDKGTIQSYGSEAELQHIQLENCSNHFLFREFIWDLFCANETVPENLIAVNGRKMKSIDVVTSILGHMISHIETRSRLQSQSLELEYVLTIPTCACKDSRAFMRKAAVKAGCPSGNIKIVEEAAAVLQFCLNNKQDGGIAMLDAICNRKFLVVECEEDNATMSVLHFINKNKIEIVFKNNTEIWKGGHVLDDFVKMISFEARKTMMDFFEKHPLEYYDFLQEVKSKIRRISADCPKFNIKISADMLEEIRCSKDMQKSVLRTGYKDELKIRGDKCVIKSERFQNLFTEAGKRIVDYIEKELFTEFSNIDEIILVGEFAQSPILQNIIETLLSAKNIIIPREGIMSAVRGAVFFGQRRESEVTDIVYERQHTPLTHAQVALPKAVTKERGLRKSMMEDGTQNPEESKEIFLQRLCVIL